ncbi:hypothetical protein BLIC30S_00600 [Bacillus licheniformis]
MNTHQNRYSVQSKVSALINCRLFQSFITTVIVLNAISIGLETYAFFKPYQKVFFIVDCLFLTIFVIELSLKLFVQKQHFFKNNWNVFDFVIVAGSLILYNTNFVSVLRIFRVLRVLRTITSVPSLRRIVNALFMAIPTISSVIILMSIIFYVYAVIGTMFFSRHRAGILRQPAAQPSDTVSNLYARIVGKRHIQAHFCRERLVMALFRFIYRHCDFHYDQLDRRGNRE